MDGASLLARAVAREEGFVRGISFEVGKLKRGKDRFAEKGGGRQIRNVRRGRRAGRWRAMGTLCGVSACSGGVIRNAFDCRGVRGHYAECGRAAGAVH